VLSVVVISPQLRRDVIISLILLCDFYFLVTLHFIHTNRQFEIICACLLSFLSAVILLVTLLSSSIQEPRSDFRLSIPPKHSVYGKEAKVDREPDMRGWTTWRNWRYPQISLALGIALTFTFVLNLYFKFSSNFSSSISKTFRDDWGRVRHCVTLGPFIRAKISRGLNKPRLK
jgi:hypothetical protein